MSTMSKPDVAVAPNWLTLGLRIFSIVRIVLYLCALAGSSVDFCLLAFNDDIHTHQRFCRPTPTSMLTSTSRQVLTSTNSPKLLHPLLIIQSSLVALKSIFAISISFLVFHAVGNFHRKDEAPMRLWANVLLALFFLSVAQMASVEFALRPQNSTSSIECRHFYVDFGLALFDLTYIFIVYCFNEDVNNGSILHTVD